jgi:lipase ATG15
MTSIRRGIRYVCHYMRSDLNFMRLQSFPFGWEDAANGFRGHVFLSPENSTVILSIKGTTLNGPTSKKDKFNDNLLFSCCCAFVDLSWVFSTVCNCYSSHWRCDNACLSEALIQDSLFYNIGVVSIQTAFTR